MMMSGGQLIEIHRRHRLSRFRKAVKTLHSLRSLTKIAPYDNIHDDPQNKKSEEIQHKSAHNVLLSLAAPSAPR